MSQYFINDKKLKEDIKKINVKVKEQEFTFFTDNGVFNKKGLDYGTRVLLENFSFDNKMSFLDMGCGCGPVGIFIAKTNDSYTVDMVDVNEKAVNLSKLGLKENNIKNANVFISDAYKNIKNRYDAILINPPIHAGKKKVYEIIGESINYLNNDGEVWVVIRKDQGAKSLIKDMTELNFEIIKRDNGFYILKSNIDINKK